MFNINDTVMYGYSGVCKISDIVQRKVKGVAVDYYVLKPVYDQNSTIFCPVDNEKIAMRNLLTKDEVYELISVMPDASAEWIENEQLRKEKCSEVLKSGDHRELIKLIKALYSHREQALAAGKKFHACDERAMKEAEESIYSEFAHVLNIKPDEVTEFIMGQLEKEE